jgi:Glycosyltransferase family 87
MTFWAEFIHRWLGGISGVAAGFAFCFYFVLVAGAFWDRRTTAMESFGLLCGGVATVVLSKFAVPLGMPSLSTSLFSIAAFSTLYAVLAVLYFRQSPISKITSARRTSVYPQSSLFSDTTPRAVRGTLVGVPLAIAVAVGSVLAIGLSCPQVMVGDEVTHYYMLAKQADDLSTPNFYAEIPMASGAPEVRRYPHSFFWHYLGAVVFRLSGGSFAAVQIYQSLFFLQLLVVAYLLARDRSGVESRAALAYVVVFASLPLCLIFSVTFYQDVPLTAQVLTAFYFLQRGRWLAASLFMALAIGLKVTAVLFYPAFFLLLIYWQIRNKGWSAGFFACGIALFIVLGSTWFVGRTIVTYGQSEFYPQAKMEQLLKKSVEFLSSTAPILAEKMGVDKVNTNLSARPEQSETAKDVKPPIIANHPGDLREKQNYLIYGGILIWLVFGAGLIGQIWISLQKSRNSLRSIHKNSWLLIVGGTYTLLAAWMTKTSPDARFFLPGLPFLLLPFVEKAAFLPKPKILLSTFVAVALLQGSYVLQKSYQLRELPVGMLEGIKYLSANPPEGHIFMYPEGNYRFFPLQHEWYLGYRLREFWRGSNDRRLEILRKYKVGAIVVKKHLIAPVDVAITNLGVYPPEFVNDLRSDARFAKIFENKELLIFLVPK